MVGIIKKTPIQYKIANHLCSADVLPKNSANLRGIIRKYGIGYQNNMPDILNKVWHRAIWSEFFKFCDANAVKMPVIVVPILLPSTNGNIFFIFLFLNFIL